MNIVLGVLYVVEIIVALLLIGIILIQPSRSGGGLGAMGGGVTEAVFGAGAGNVLTKATVILATVFLVLTLALVVITAHRKGARSVVEELPAASEVQRPPEPAAAATVPAVEPAAPAAEAVPTTPATEGEVPAAGEAAPAPAPAPAP